MSRLRLIAGACAWLLAAPGPSAAPAGEPAGARAEATAALLAPNGLQVLVLPRPGSRTVFVEIGVRVGSRDEPLALAGMSHLLEHLLFKEGHQNAGATPRNPAFSALRAAGAEINASTDFELTEYHADLPADRFEEGWRALVAMVTATAFDQADVERERGVVLQEVALGKTDPLAIMAYSVLRQVFPGDPLGQPVIGFRKTLRRITAQDLQGYYRRHYVPANMFAVIAGDVDRERATELVLNTLGSDSSARGLAHPVYPKPVLRVERLYRFKTLVSQSYLLAGALTGGEESGDAPALSLLATILGEGKSSRLHRRLVEREALTNELLAVSFNVSNAGAFSVGLAVDPGKADAARAALLEELALLAREPVSQEELATARMKARGRLLRELETNAGSAGFLARRHLLRQPPDPQLYLDELDRLSASELQVIAASTWGEDSGPGPIEIQVLPARGLGKVVAALKFLFFKRL